MFRLSSAGADAGITTAAVAGYTDVGCFTFDGIADDVAGRGLPETLGDHGLRTGRSDLIEVAQGLQEHG